MDEMQQFRVGDRVVMYWDGRPNGVPKGVTSTRGTVVHTNGRLNAKRIRVRPDYWRRDVYAYPDQLALAEHIDA
jgi:hypothetical protein